MSNPMQSYDPSAAPSPMTPADSPAVPAGYAEVTPHGRGPAPYDIQAEMPDIAGPFAESVAVAGPGVLYPQSPRQAQTEQLLNSPQGYGAFSITGGFSGGGGEDWPSDVSPGANAETPDQGSGDFQGTTQDGLQKYGTS